MTETMPQLGPPGRQTCRVDDEAWTEVLRLVTEAYPREDTEDRRRDSRYPFPFLVYLTPVGEDGIPPLASRWWGRARTSRKAGWDFTTHSRCLAAG